MENVSQNIIHFAIAIGIAFTFLSWMIGYGVKTYRDITNSTSETENVEYDEDESYEEFKRNYQRFEDDENELDNTTKGEK